MSALLRYLSIPRGSWSSTVLSSALLSPILHIRSSLLFPPRQVSFNPSVSLCQNYRLQKATYSGGCNWITLYFELLSELKHVGVSADSAPAVLAVVKTRRTQLPSAEMKTTFSFVSDNNVTHSIIFTNSSREFVKLNFPDFPGLAANNFIMLQK